MERRGFLGALFSGAAVTAGGVMIPKAVAASQKIEVSAPPELIKALESEGEIVVCDDVSSIPDGFFEARSNLYQEWWKQASPKLLTMPKDKYEAFIEAHVRVNGEFGINPDVGRGPWIEAEVGLKTPYG